MTYQQLMRILRILASVEGYLWADMENAPEWMTKELGEVQDIVQIELTRIAGEELK